MARNAQAAAPVTATRVWPAQEYTRVTFETAKPVRHQFFSVQDPERLVVDLEGVELNSVLESLPSKVLDNDPYIRVIRAGQNRPGVVRVVVELKAAINPQVFPTVQISNYWTSSSSPNGGYFGCTTYTFYGHDFCREPVANERPFFLVMD